VAAPGTAGKSLPTERFTSKQRVGGSSLWNGGFVDIFQGRYRNAVEEKIGTFSNALLV
jgi:hypothetical protein